MRTLFVLALAARLAWAQQMREEAENPVAGNPQAIEAGRKLFAGSCGGCHGATGEGGRGPNLRDGRAVRRSSDAQMFQTIRKGIAGTDMPGTNLPDARVWELVAFVRSLGLPAGATAFPGDPVKGERVYAANGCSGCHMIAGRGGLLGPDLSNAGGTQSYDYLREAILKPSDRVAAGYRKAVATMKDGRKIEGVARNYSNYSVELQAKNGELYLLNTADLADFQVSVATYMPSYAAKLNKEELTDLLAYLCKQTLRPIDLKTMSGRRRGGPR
jgi:putative heme-binding domain-containing protein